MGWRIGDLGRFKAEDDGQPRFEVVGATKEGVTVWYGGKAADEQTVIPLTTFKHDCVNWWSVSMVVNPDGLPTWFRKGASFQLSGRGRRAIQARVPWMTHPKGYASATLFETVDVGQSELVIRSIRSDYISALWPKPNVLILLSLQDVLSYAYHRRTRWDRLVQGREDIVDELFDLYDE